MTQNQSVLLVLTDPIVYPPVMPYGARILQTALTSKGVSSSVIWPHLDGVATDVLRKRLETGEFSIVGFSFRNLDMAGFHYSDSGEDHFIGALQELVAEAKRIGALTVIGGSGFSIAPNEIIEYVNGDVGFVGPSENHFAEFCERIIQKGSTSKEALSGLTSGFVAKEPAPSPIPLPLLAPSNTDHRTVEYAKLVGGMVPLRTKSGCSGKCTYCVVPSIEPLIIRSWREIFDELKLYVAAGLGSRIFIADGEFNLPSLEWAIEFSQRLKKQFSDQIKWRCYLNPASVSRKLTNAMVAANCVGVSLSVDSFADEPRKGLGKDGSADVAIEAVNCCLAANFNNILVNLIFGAPGETIETAQKTANIAKSFLEKGVGVNVTVGLRVYPETPLAQLIKKSQFAQHYESCSSISWLGKFCSPVPALQLASYVEDILKEKEGVIYNHSQPYNDTSFYQTVAYSSGLLFRGEFEYAKEKFEDLIAKYGRKPELELGLLKAKARVSEITNL